MLFKRRDLDGVAAGEITVAFRRWKRPTVRAGGTLTTRAGVLAIETVERVDPARITTADARRAGRGSAAEVRAELDARAEGEPYRVSFRLIGPDPRIALRENAVLTDAEVADLRARLARLDERSPHGPWTDASLDLIERNPGVRAADLAERLGRERLSFKADVRKLKRLGLTESLERGYRISPRGRALRSAP
jgi:hypothetical protein